ncbi:STAS-like domain-containing protein [Leptolyngbya boryana CZ1]|uniref:STAS-like domain-containing protein n=1 Tax=Leptolyngbya boryana CZ1 TaxID=3060204 RepID=A0AA96WW03_LEPBY|nr:STAS-like domain-containing protein [Leptolyngbya boryana]WNZ46113.1 STAS-like domain-containing protein [Leptolyngbya boryana CZ1]
MKYNVQSIAGAYCTTPEAGQKLYKEIYPSLTQGTAIELDFLGVKAYASAFFNYAIGQLLRDISADQLRDLIHFTNISATGENVLKLVIDSAKQYYSDERFQKSVNAALEEEVTAC